MSLWLKLSWWTSLRLKNVEILQPWVRVSKWHHLEILKKPLQLNKPFSFAQLSLPGIHG